MGRFAESFDRDDSGVIEWDEIALPILAAVVVVGLYLFNRVIFGKNVSFPPS